MNSTAIGLAVMAEHTALLQLEQAVPKVDTGRGGASAFRVCSTCSRVYKAALAVALEKWTSIPELRTGTTRGRTSVVVLKTPFSFGGQATLVSSDAQPTN
jgi:hypothetical protein